MDRHSESSPPVDIGPRPAGAPLRALMARGNRLKAGMRIGQKGTTDAVIDELRRMFGGDDLIKVRVDAEDKTEVQAVAEELTRRVPCHLIQHVGRVILLYHPKSENPS